MKTIMVKHLLCAASAALFLSGCATTANNPKDPFEGFNRAMFSVNEGIDVVVKPVAQGYDAVLPSPVKTGVGNFFGNIGDVWIAINNFLQGKPGQGVSDVGRVLVNTTVGIVGLFDVASEIGLEKHSEDFGQTLGAWGVGEGPYLYWPIFGPRTTRDTFGLALDVYVDPVANLDDVSWRNSLTALRLIDLRASMLPADKVVEQAALDKYNYIRDAYLQNRRSEVSDGKAKRANDDTDPCKKGACN